MAKSKGTPIASSHTHGIAMNRLTAERQIMKQFQPRFILAFLAFTVLFPCPGPSTAVAVNSEDSAVFHEILLQKDEVRAHNMPPPVTYILHVQDRDLAALMNQDRAAGAFTNIDKVPLALDLNDLSNDSSAHITTTNFSTGIFFKTGLLLVLAGLAGWPSLCRWNKNRTSF